MVERLIFISNTDAPEVFEKIEEETYLQRFWFKILLMRWLITTEGDKKSNKNHFSDTFSTTSCGWWNHCHNCSFEFFFQTCCLSTHLGRRRLYLLHLCQSSPKKNRAIYGSLRPIVRTNLSSSSAPLTVNLSGWTWSDSRVFVQVWRYQGELAHSQCTWHLTNSRKSESASEARTNTTHPGIMWCNYKVGVNSADCRLREPVPLKKMIYNVNSAPVHVAVAIKRGSMAAIHRS